MKWIIGLLLAATAAAWLCVAVESRAVQAEYEVSAVETDPIVRFAHSYHGILGSVYNKTTGDRYFYRNGKKCPLLTSAMLLAYEGRK